MTDLSCIRQTNNTASISQKLVLPVSLLSAKPPEERREGQVEPGEPRGDRRLVSPLLSVPQLTIDSGTEPRQPVSRLWALSAVILNIYVQNVIVRYWHMQLWRLRSPTVCCLQVRGPRKPGVSS